jgi:GMP synthase-like glutamine amidotransferase
MITVGLLECDHVAPEFTAIAGDYRDMFGRLLPDVAFQYYDVCNGQFPDSANACDAYLCTGSRYSVYDDIDWIVRLKAFVRNIQTSGKQYVGVCFGHQLLGEALGGKVEKAATGWNVGIHAFNMHRTEGWMQPFQPRVQLMMMCQDQVIRLPEQAVLLAAAETCPVAMFQVGNNMLGIQGHPEFPKAYEAALLESRRGRIGDEKTTAGLDSLVREVDDGLMSRWMFQFLAGVGPAGNSAMQ